MPEIKNKHRNMKIRIYYFNIIYKRKRKRSYEGAVRNSKFNEFSSFLINSTSGATY